VRQGHTNGEFSLIDLIKKNFILILRSECLFEYSDREIEREKISGFLSFTVLRFKLKQKKRRKNSN
jgi:hypothetical protein